MEEANAKEIANAELVSFIGEREEPKSISVETAFLAASDQGEITMLTTLTGTLIFTSRFHFL